MLDGSVGTVIDGVEVFDIGDEAVHFRDVLQRRRAAQLVRPRHRPQQRAVRRGRVRRLGQLELVEVPVHRRRRGRLDEGDNTERVLIEDNVFEDITAEGADLKEGTDSGTLRRNVFRRAGTSGQNSADSAVDAKGNNWVIEDNVVSETDADVGRRRRRRARASSPTASSRTRSTTATAPATCSAATGWSARSRASASACTRRSATSSRATTPHRGAAKGLVGDKSKATSCPGRPLAVPEPSRRARRSSVCRVLACCVALAVLASCSGDGPPLEDAVQGGSTTTDRDQASDAGARPDVLLDIDDDLVDLDHGRGRNGDVRPGHGRPALVVRDDRSTSRASRASRRGRAASAGDDVRSAGPARARSHRRRDPRLDSGRDPGRAREPRSRAR